MMKALFISLIILALFVLIGGVLGSISYYEQGVAVGSACFLAILARIAQASAHHKELISINRKRPESNKIEN